MVAHTVERRDAIAAVDQAWRVRHLVEALVASAYLFLHKPGVCHKRLYKARPNLLRRRSTISCTSATRSKKAPPKNAAEPNAIAASSTHNREKKRSCAHASSHQ